MVQGLHQLIENTIAPVDHLSRPVTDNDDGFDDRDPTLAPEPPSSLSPPGQKGLGVLQLL